MGNICNTEQIDIHKYKGTEIPILDDIEITPIEGRIVCLMAVFDYKGPGVDNAKIPTLSGSRDGKRFAKLVEACRAEHPNIELRAYFDNEVLASSESKGFPQKAKIVGEFQGLAKELGEDDCLVFYFSGHGVQIPDRDGDEEDGMDEAMLFVEPDGSVRKFLDDEITALLSKFNPETRVIVITDCCHSGTMCDLYLPHLHGRPIFHMTATKDHEEAVDLGDGGAFTTCLLEAVKKTSHVEEYSMAQLHNVIVGNFQQRFAKEQTFTLSCPGGVDPQECPWPFKPPKNWKLLTKFDGQVRIMGATVNVPGMIGMKKVVNPIKEGRSIEAARGKMVRVRENMWEKKAPGFPAYTPATRGAQSVFPAYAPTPTGVQSVFLAYTPTPRGAQSVFPAYTASPSGAQLVTPLTTLSASTSVRSLW